MTMRFCCVLALLPVLGSGQVAPPPPAIASARIEGSVLNDITGQPLARARVFLRAEAGQPRAVAVDSDDKGGFAIPSVTPGRYSLSAERDGYLPASSAFASGSRLSPVIQIEAGGNLRDIRFRLHPASVIAGRVRFHDAEPAVNVLVRVYQDSYARGRSSFRIVASVRTNDRGEYRASGIPPGFYYIAAVYDRPNYPAAFYPDAQNLAGASRLEVRSGEESGGIDIDLRRVPTFAIRGQVFSGLTGHTVPVPVRMQWLSAGERSSINAAVAAPSRSGDFELHDVAAGPYVLVADSFENGTRLFGRSTVVVGEQNIADLQIQLLPERSCHGTVQADGVPGVVASALRVVFEPRSDLNPIARANVNAQGQFSINLAADEIYDAYVLNAPGEVYIQSTRVGNQVIGSQGISGQLVGPNAPVEIALSGKDGVLAGRIRNTGGAFAGGASIMVVPDAAGHPQNYRSGRADDTGNYQIRGLAPGAYTAFAYYDQPPCEFYDVESLAACRSRGTAFTANGAAQTTLDLRVP